MSGQHYWKIITKNNKRVKEVHWKDNPNFFKVKNKNWLLRAASKKVLKVYRVTGFNSLVYQYWIPATTNSINKFTKKLDTSS